MSADGRNEKAMERTRQSKKEVTTTTYQKEAGA